MMKPNKFVIEKQVSTFRTENGLGSAEPVNFRSLLLKLNILTIFRPLSENFSGMCLKDKSNHRFMLVNSNNSLGRQHFTIAHELYHLFIEAKPTPHKCNPGNAGQNPAERDADMFASHLLMPATGIFQLISEDELNRHDVNMASIVKLEQYFSVSRTALLYRLLNLEIIKKPKYYDLINAGVKSSAKSFGYDTALYEPANEGLVIGDFGKKARNLFESGRISEGHYVELLHKINVDVEG